MITPSQSLSYAKIIRDFKQGELKAYYQHLIARKPAEDFFEKFEKHLPGQHEQKDHGTWATGGGEGYLSQSTDKEIQESRALFQELMGPDADIDDILIGSSWESEKQWDRLNEKLIKRYQEAGMGKNSASLQANIDLGRVTYALRLDKEKAMWEEGQARRKAEGDDPNYEWHKEAKSDYENIQKGLEVAQAKVIDAMENGQVTMAATETVLGSIFNDGRYKNQFETRASGGTLDVGIRKEGEGKALGVPAGTKLAERPVYGFITTNEESITMEQIYGQRKQDDSAGIPSADRTNNERNSRWTNILSVNNYEVEQYGEIRFTLKPEVRSRTTVTIGDSLRSGIMADNLTNPKPNLTYMGLYKEGATDHVGGLPIARYVEAQIYGGVKVSDIAHIYAPAGRVDAVKAMVAAQGLDIPVSPRAGS